MLPDSMSYNTAVREYFLRVGNFPSVCVVTVTNRARFSETSVLTRATRRHVPQFVQTHRTTCLSGVHLDCDEEAFRTSSAAAACYLGLNSLDLRHSLAYYQTSPRVYPCQLNYDRIFAKLTENGDDMTENLARIHIQFFCHLGLGRKNSN
jgi:hypothetical protein